jgi:hypothetical protein
VPVAKDRCTDQPSPAVGRRSPIGSDRAPLAISARIFALSYGLLLCITFWRLESPPYVEQSAGLWAEASWLVDHGFDYYRLRHHEKHVEDGGPRSYFTSILPTLLSVIMISTSSSTKTIIAYRLFNLACVAWILTLQFDLIHRRHGVGLAIVTVTATACFPLFAVQIEMLGLDIPMVAGAMTWWWLIDQARHREALGWAIGTFLLKPSAFVLPASVVGYSLIAWVLYFITGRRGGLPRRTGWAVANFAVMTTELWILSRSGNLHGRVMPFIDLQLWLRSSPDLLIVAGVAIILVLAILLQFYWNPTWQNTTSLHSTSNLNSETEQLSWILTGMGVITATLASATMTYYESRHLTIVVPMVLTLFAIGIAKLSRSWPTAFTALTICLAWGVINRFGILYTPLADQGRGWGVPERSLEYVLDHESNQRAIAVALSHRESSAVVATDHFIYFLALPRLGYVRMANEDPRSTYRFTAVDDDVLKILEDQPETLLVLHAPEQLGNWPFPAYRLADPDENDEVLFRDSLDPRTVIYKRFFPRNGSLSQKIQRYLDLLFSNDTSSDVVIRLIILGQQRLAYRCLAEEMRLSVDNPEVRKELLRRLQAHQEAFQAESLEGRRAELRDRRVQTIRDRIAEVVHNTPARPLVWTERTYLGTWQQRVRYFPNLAEPENPAGADGRFD